MDRFDSMRSKGINTNDADATAEDIAMGKTAYVKGQKITGISTGGGGGNYDALGTTVTVEAQGAIGKGDRWVGILNDEFARESLGSQLISISGVFFNSNHDVYVATANNYLTTTTTTKSVYVYNLEAQTFQRVQTDVSHIGSSLSYQLDCCDINEDGTLVIFSSYGTDRTGLAVLEIDKENFTARAYYQELNVANASVHPMLAKDYLIQMCLDNGGNRIYKYDWENHKFVQIQRGGYNLKPVPAYSMGNSLDGYNSTPGIKAWADEKTLIFHNGTYLCKYVFSDNGVTDSYATLSTLNSNLSGNYITLSSNASYLMSNKSSYINIFSLNVNDLSVTQVRRWGHGEGSSARFCVDGTLGVINNKVYDISNIAIENPSLILQKSNSTPTSSHTFSIKKWYNNTAQSFYTFPQGGTAQYLISPVGYSEMATGKFYGIASSSLALGDVGTAQLLFTT